MGLRAAQAQECCLAVQRLQLAVAPATPPPPPPPARPALQRNRLALQLQDVDGQLREARQVSSPHEQPCSKQHPRQQRL